MSDKYTAHSFKDVNGSTEDKISKYDIKMDELNAISENQILPIELVVELYVCKGSISDKEFMKRISGNEK
ncbi:MAG: hypothetical protein JW995_08880 [Melioribacteraceae bacterium]|nr:hypothetical protein [Melioribacteraceae bacterium]